MLRLSRDDIFPKGTVPLKAVETALSQTVGPVSYECVKLVYVTGGAAEVETDDGSMYLREGHVLVLGADTWSLSSPRNQIQIITIYVDEKLLRSQASWLFPRDGRIPFELHPLTWDGRTLVLDVGTEVITQVGPILRKLASIDPVMGVDTTAARRIALLVDLISTLLPFMLNEPTFEVLHSRSSAIGPAAGDSQRDGSIRAEVRSAAQLLREDLAREWSLAQLAQEVALSQSQLVRLFNAELGVSPMAYLVQVRLAEFRRLLEQTDLPIQVAARKVGWADQRVAARWFLRKWRVLPREFRGRIRGQRR